MLAPLHELLPSTRRGRRCVLACVVVGVAARLALVAFMATPGEPRLWEFGDVAKNLLETGVYSYHRPGVPSAWVPPGYTLVVTAALAVFGTGGGPWALAVLLFGAAVAIPLLVGRVTALAWSPSAGRIAFALAWVWPSLLALSGRLHSITLSLLLLLGAVAVILDGSRRVLARAAWAGFLLGVYGLFRNEMPVLLPAFLLVAWRAGRDEGASVGRRLGACAVLVGVACACLAPWVARNHVVFGRPLVSTAGGYNLLRGHDAGATGAARGWTFQGGAGLRPGVAVPVAEDVAALSYETPGDELVADAWYRAKALEHVRGNPRGELRLLGKKLLFFLVTDFTHPAFRHAPAWLPSLVALTVGLFCWLRAGAPGAAARFTWLLFTLQLAVTLAFFVLPRHRITVDFVPLGAFAAALAAWFRDPPRRAVADLVVGHAADEAVGDGA